MVGESFGMNPLKSGGIGKAESKVFDRRDKIQDNFLEEEDEQSSVGGISDESGEIDPALFR
jgi:hypothetical protein